MKPVSATLPLWARIVLLLGIVGVTVSAGLATYRFYTRPTTLGLAVGSFDGEAAQIASIVAGRLAATNAPVRLKLVPTDNALDSAKLFAAGEADLAIVRADVGDLSQARSVALVAKSVLMILALPGSDISGIEKLRGHTVGVVGGEVNRQIVDALKKEYDLGDKVTFRSMAPADVPRAVQSKQIGALLLVIPLNEKYLSLLRGQFRDRRSFPVLLPVESAGAIAEAEGAYESFDIPQGTLRGNPPVPDADLTTLRVGSYLVANKKLDSDLITTLTQALMNARNDLVRDQPLLAGIAAPDTDPNAYIAVHPGAAAYYNGTQQSFMDRYGDWIYLTPMILGAMASIFAAAWRFLGIREHAPEPPALKTLFALPRRIRQVTNEAELSEIEGQIDDALESELSKAIDDGNPQDILTLTSLSNRLEDSVLRRRQALAAKPPSSDG